MLCGIYALYWEQSSMVYVGKSINIDRRYKTHLRQLQDKEHANYKIQEQYNAFGKPNLVLLELGEPSSLNSLEHSWINEFDSVVSGLNIVTADSAAYSGPVTSTAKYSRKQVLRTFSLLYRTDMILTDIARRARVNVALATNIAYNGQHRWLEEEYPDKYAKMLSRLKGNRMSRNKSGFNNPRAKYTKRQVLKAFSLLYRTRLSRVKIANRLGVPIGLIKGLLDSGTHSWLKLEYPEQYERMLSRKSHL